jgi:uncharacterized protein YbjT (DUF2867 family)
MPTIAVIGGTGTVGRHIAAALERAGGQAPDGVQVRIVSRHSPTHPADLATGRGLAPALEGADVVVDAGNGPPRDPEPVLVTGARHLAEAAAAAGVRHLVCVSIVGIDRVPMRYYRAKVAQEHVVREGAVPWSIVRSTQFHELLDAAFGVLARFRLTPRTAVPLQPVAAAEAATAVAETALGDPLTGTVSVAGPEVRSAGDFARMWARRRGGVLVPLPVPAVMPGGRALRGGALTDPAAPHRGGTSFEAWLGTRDG